jgi:hypothetical protein
MYSLHVTSLIIYYVIISLNMIYNDYNESLHKMTLVDIQRAMNKNVTQIVTRQHATSWSTRVWKIGCASLEWIDELS